MENKEIPNHLEGLATIINIIYYNKPDAEEYADIAFSLAKIGQGDKDALAKVTSFIQNKYEREKKVHSQVIEMKSDLSSWLSWATHWLVRKPS